MVTTTAASQKKATTMSSSLSTVAFELAVTFRSRSNAHAAAARLYCMLPPSDPLFDDMDFIDAPDVIATSTSMDMSSGPFRHVAALAVQNKSFKPRMEDVCVIQPNLGADVQFYAVYDGHGSPVVSTYLGQHLHVELSRQCSRRRSSSSSGCSATTMETALADTFEAIDRALESLDAADHCGSTAVVLVAHGNHLVTVANCGDSHCLHVNAQGDVRRLTQDHHVRNAAEVSRITGANGMIVRRRVSGVSKVTRAFGQHNEKDFVIARPAIATLSLKEQNRPPLQAQGYFVLMTDGISDVLGDNEIAAYVGMGLAMGWRVDAICQTLVDLCKLKRTRDNLTVVIVLV
ncbi:hypothetical protein DYB25_006382 [Aphanomyces astaci]|uniref:protein-serine/threonine phosphatase n=1 Tax=Aphanomyces astaci TaxID=112090 RepID=A0A397BZN5_APHAT|nr:hypothetical protein DYB25_006382 [Aphanomyces astaci]